MPVSVVILDEVDSTNTYALKHLVKLPHMSAIFADSQISGRGRCGRKWHSPEGNIYASFVLKNIRYPPACAGFATCLAGLYTLRALTAQCEFAIKLPNDIICENRKIAGILCEFRKVNNQNAIVAGIGLNINTTEEELKNSGTEVASLFTLTKKKYDLNSVRKKLIKYAEYSFSLPEGKIVSEFVQNCIMIGKQIAVKDAGKELEGRLKKILSDGAAEIETSDGKIRKFYSGDFTLS